MTLEREIHIKEADPSVRYHHGDGEFETSIATIKAQGDCVFLKRKSIPVEVYSIDYIGGNLVERDYHLDEENDGLRFVLGPKGHLELRIQGETKVYIVSSR